MKTVTCRTQRPIPQQGVLCMALAHNEAKRVKDFLRHYRRLGVAHFLILDDRSDDGTMEILREQKDVTLFVPDGSNYRDHKIAWRKEILGAHADGRWVIVPDLDELFVYPHCDSRPVGAFAAHIEREGAEAVFAPMVEMYADVPLEQPVYRPGESMLAACPFFDSDGYRLLMPKHRYLKDFPAPGMELYGGARERLFYDFSIDSLGAVRRWVLRRFSHLRRSMQPGFGEWAGNMLARLALKGNAPQDSIVMSKVPMLKWRAGLTFAGGPHRVSQALSLSANWGALLHFKFIDLPAQVAYNAARGQHVKGAVHYKTLQAKGGYNRSPIYEGSRRYESWRDLMDCGLLRCSPEWDAESPASPRRAEASQRSAERAEMFAPALR